MQPFHAHSVGNLTNSNSNTDVGQVVDEAPVEVVRNFFCYWRGILSVTTTPIIHYMHIYILTLVTGTEFSRGAHEITFSW